MLLTTLVALAAPLLVTAEPVRTPAPGTTERAAIMNGLRPLIENDMGKPIEFVVGSIKVADGFAFIRVTPQRPGGGAIAIRETIYSADAEMMGGLVTYALLQQRGSAWSVLSYVVGPTDVAWTPWADQFGAPQSIFQ